MGIISRGLHGHTIGKLNLGIIKNLSREKFEVIIFRVPEKKDRLAREIDQAADRGGRTARAGPGSPAGKRVAEHSLDILFFLDIGMDPLTYFLAFFQAGPGSMRHLGASGDHRNSQHGLFYIVKHR